jgi:hypothetical protein
MLRELIQMMEDGVVEELIREADLYLCVDDVWHLYVGNGMMKGPLGVIDVILSRVSAVRVGQPSVVPSPEYSTPETQALKATASSTEKLAVTAEFKSEKQATPFKKPTKSLFGKL